MWFNKTIKVGSGAFVVKLNESSGPTVPQAYDIHRFLTVPDQVTASSTFDVQLVTAMADPDAAEVAPTITVNGGGAVVASLVDLKYPDSNGLPTAETSTQVYEATVTLADGDNTIAINGTTTRINIKKKTSLNSVTVTDRAGFQAQLLSACHGTSIDEIVLNYAEADLPEAMNGANVQFNTSQNSGRNSWITIKPGTGSIAWPRSSTGTNLSALRDTGSGVTPFRPNGNYLCFENVTIGASDDDQTVAGLSTESQFKYWLKNCSETFKYDYSYTSSRSGPDAVFEVPGNPYPPHDSGATATGNDALIDYNNTPTTTVANPTAANGTLVYQTGCTTRGTAAQIGNLEICTGNYYTEIRFDPNNNSRVFANCYIDGCTTVKTVRSSEGIPVDYDSTHLDLCQWWGSPEPGDLVSTAYENIVAVGLKAVNSGTLDMNIQTCLFDRTYDSERTNLIMRDVVTEMPTGANNFFQFAGNLTNVRIENLSMANNGYITFRRNFTDTSFVPAQFNPEGVYLKNISVDVVNFVYAGGAGDVSYGWDNVANTSDISTELNGEAASEAEYANKLFFDSPIAVSVAPPYVTLSAVSTGNLNGGGTVYTCTTPVPPDQLLFANQGLGSASYTFYSAARTVNPYIDGGITFSFANDTDAQNADASANGNSFRLTVTLGSNPTHGSEGDTLVYETTAASSGNVFVGSTNSSSARYIPSGEWTLQTVGSGYTGDWINATEHWGDNPLMVITLF